jgi:hypothetical protein
MVSQHADHHPRKKDAVNVTLTKYLSVSALLAFSDIASKWTFGTEGCRFDSCRVQLVTVLKNLISASPIPNPAAPPKCV